MGIVVEVAFPVGAGMNRRARSAASTCFGVPRRRRDEPVQLRMRDPAVWRSLQARG